MATLAADSPRTLVGTLHIEHDNGLPMIDNDIIYAGAAVGEKDDTGTFRPLASADKFAGFCYEQADNTRTGHAAGEVNVKVHEKGYVVLSVTGVTAITDVGKDVYASDDDTFTLTVGGSLIGRIVRWISSTKCVVYFESFYHRAAVVGTHDAETVDLATDRSFFLATRPYYVRRISQVHSVAAGGASKLQVTKDTGTDAPGAGTDLLTNNTNAGFDLAATANTVQEGAIVTTAGVRKLAVGDRLSRDNADAIQSTAGVKIGYELIPL
jgi:hypothetical protein